MDRNLILGLRLSGILLLIAGLLLPFVHNLPLQATVIFDPNPPTITSTYPDGDPSNPTSLAAGSAVIVYAVVSDDVDDPTEIVVKAKVTYGTQNETLTLTPAVDGSGSYLRHEAEWTVPSWTPETITFVFEATDLTGNKASIDAYAAVSDETSPPPAPEPEPEPNPNPNPNPTPSPPEFFNVATVLGVSLTAASFILEKRR